MANHPHFTELSRIFCFSSLQRITPPFLIACTPLLLIQRWTLSHPMFFNRSSQERTLPLQPQFVNNGTQWSTKYWRTVNLEYHDWVLNKAYFNMTFQGLPSMTCLRLIRKLRRLSIGGRKLRLFCPSSRPPIGARAGLPHRLFLDYLVTGLALEMVSLPLLNLGTYIHRISPWWTGVTIPLFGVTLYFLATQSFRTMDMIRMKGIGLAHLHLLESVSIEFPPSRLYIL
ncbi:hypothetical protein Ocin01_08349 [Orchesella cincta]|uniref:Uncharacterized protein n=1 Tax=Orchesella cincta TaxID=48709 RepID=A0A1D2MZ63_ORCCI|nr:hypothetical protein Ocin01_08349 [Orchesella cincta]